MTLEDCPDCAGASCQRYQKQRQHKTLGIRLNVEAGLAIADGQVRDQIYRCLSPSPKVQDSDVFQVHVLPGDSGSTDYVAMLANRSLLNA